MTLLVYTPVKDGDVGCLLFLGVNRGCQSEHCSVVSLHLWTMKSIFFSPCWRSLECLFSTPFDVCLIIWPLLSSPFALDLSSVSLLFSSSKQVSGLFCCVMWLGVKIRKVSLCSKACDFYFYPQLLELIAKSQLTSLSGIAQKNYMNILEKVVQKGKKRKRWGGGARFNLVYSVWTTSSIKSGSARRVKRGTTAGFCSAVPLSFPLMKDSGGCEEPCVYSGRYLRGDSSSSIPCYHLSCILTSPISDCRRDGCSCPQPGTSAVYAVASLLLSSSATTAPEERKAWGVSLSVEGLSCGWDVALPSLML